MRSFSMVKRSKQVPTLYSDDLPFFHYQPASGHPDWSVLQREARLVVEELRPTLERPQSRWSMLSRRMKAYRSTIQNYRTNRALDRAGREDLRPLYFIWTILRHCNFACGYCDDHQGQKYPDLPKKGTLNTEEGLELMRIMRTRTPSIYFAGGEPTIRKDLPTLTRAARDLNYYPIIINTNGSMIERNLRKEQWRTWLADTDVIVVSLDALDLQLLRRMWVFRRPEDVLRGLLILRELAQEMKFKLMVNCVIQPGLVHEARAVLDLVNDLGIWFCPVPVNIGPKVDRRLHEDPAYQELVDTILERKREGCRITGSIRMNERLLNSEPLECRNTIKPHIDHDGRLVWPCKASVNVKPEYINVLDFDDVDALYEYASQQVDPTHFHGPSEDQCGADCNWAQNYSTDAYLHGLRNPRTLFGEVGEFLRR